MILHLKMLTIGGSQVILSGSNGKTLFHLILKNYFVIGNLGNQKLHLFFKNRSFFSELCFLPCWILNRMVQVLLEWKPMSVKSLLSCLKTVKDFILFAGLRYNNLIMVRQASFHNPNPKYSFFCTEHKREQNGNFIRVFNIKKILYLWITKSLSQSF